jgi:hypothetical protein
MNSPTDCKVYGPNGELKLEVKPEGEMPVLDTGENRVTFSCQAIEGRCARANVTSISEGAPLEAQSSKSENTK